MCQDIRDAAATVMDNPENALEIPSMVDLSEFHAEDRDAVRAEWNIQPDEVVTGWVGRLDPKKRVQDFIAACGHVIRERENARFVVIGGPDAFHPEYAEALQRQASELGLNDKILFLGDRPDVPRLLAGLDIFVWLSRGEGMPHVIAEAGAAGLPVIATRDGGTPQQITDDVSGLFVEHESPLEVAGTIVGLMDEPDLRVRARQCPARTCCPYLQRRSRDSAVGTPVCETVAGTMTDRLRLALFTDSLHPSGVGRVMELLARHLPCLALRAVPDLRRPCGRGRTGRADAALCLRHLPLHRALGRRCGRTARPGSASFRRGR